MASEKVVVFPGGGEIRRAAGLPDAAARALALDVEASWIVEAPAGSGKTGLLVQRYLKLLALESTPEPESVLAITFTRKATAELRERVMRELLDAASGEAVEGFRAETVSLARAVLERDRAVGWRLLEQPQRLRIRTIDALNADIAGALPLLSGSGSALRVTPEPAPLYREASRRTMLLLGGEDRALHAALRLMLLHRDGSLGDCEKLLVRMLAAREQWGELVPLRGALDDAMLEAEVRPKLERALAMIVCAGLEQAQRAMPEDVCEALSYVAGHLSARSGYGGGVSSIAVCGGKGKPGQTVEDLDHWRALAHLLLTQKGEWRTDKGVNNRKTMGFEFQAEDLPMLLEVLAGARGNERLREALCALRALPPARYPEEQWVVAKAIFRALRQALVELTLLFAERGECDFAEIALAAKTALASEDGAGDLSQASGAVLKHLLVDEMQDTSAAQYELIELLTRSWDGHSQTVFLVGDPKQSIYLFRQARVERFLRTMEQGRMGDVPMGALRLTANFRSQAGLVEDGFNADFALIFPADGEEPGDSWAVDVPFVEAQAVRAAGDAAGRVWHAAVLGESEEDARENAPAATLNRAREEAREMRVVVERWLAKPLPADREVGESQKPKPWRIAVLARTRGHLAAVVEEFRREDAAGGRIRYKQLEVERLGERTEVLDAMALTRALLHPADRVAWLAVLHAPWCGLGLADLLAIAGGGADGARKEALLFRLQARRELLSAEGRVLFDRAWQVLWSAWEARGRTPHAALVERAWRSLGGAAALSEEECENVGLYFEALRAVEDEGGRVDISQLNERVAELYARSAPGEAAVELLTMHRAKGLEWDVVLVPGLERTVRSSSAELLNWVEVDIGGEGVAHTVLAPIHGRGEDAGDLYKWICKVRNDREAAERKRLLYVGATRAREELHLFGAVKRDKAGELCVASGSLLKAAWPAAESAFAALDAPVSQGGGELLQMLRRSTGDEPEAQPGEVLQMAAMGEDMTPRARPTLERLPLGFDARAAIRAAGERRLPYTAAAELRTGAYFERPEGSYGARAFGNALHRYLQVLAERIAAGVNVEALHSEVTAWEPRLRASLRAEGLPPAGLETIAERAVNALAQTLADADGRWVLSAHPEAVNEAEVAMASGTLRVDRMFAAGATVGAEGATHVWIVDFKSTEAGGLAAETFAVRERSKYEAQLAAYAAAVKASGETRPVMVGLYYPLVPRFIAWAV